jgi:hypothetical protein
VANGEIKIFKAIRKFRPGVYKKRIQAVTGHEVEAEEVDQGEILYTVFNVHEEVTDEVPTLSG